jgi:hypothetical protein
VIRRDLFLPKTRKIGVRKQYNLSSDSQLEMLD